MTDDVRLPMPTHRRQRWWRRRGPSVMVLLALLAVMVLGAVALWDDVAEVLPIVGKAQQGEDPWRDAVGIEKVGDFHLAHIPDCAAAPVVRIELWDEDSEAYWAVSGPPTPMASFVVGALPPGWTEVTPFREPPRESILRLVVVRSVKGVAGTRYRSEDLRTGLVTTGIPPTRFEVDDFQTGRFCNGEFGGSDDEETTTTTAAG